MNGLENPADCASRDLYPTELLEYMHMWNCPDWLRHSCTEWPKQNSNTQSDEEREISLLVIGSTPSPLIPFERFSSFDHLKRITCWITRFVNNCRTKRRQDRGMSHLTTLELQQAENYWYNIIQLTHFKTEIDYLSNYQPLPSSRPLVSRNIRFLIVISCSEVKVSNNYLKHFMNPSTL